MIRLALVLSLIAAPAMAQTSWQSYPLGNSMQYQGSNGWTGSSYPLGSSVQSDFQGPNGESQHCSSYRLGSSVQTDCN